MTFFWEMGASHPGLSSHPAQRSTVGLREPKAVGGIAERKRCQNAGFWWANSRHAMKWQEVTNNKLRNPTRPKSAQGQFMPPKRRQEPNARKKAVLKQRIEELKQQLATASGLQVWTECGDCWSKQRSPFVQGEFLILDLVSSTGVEIQIEGEGHGKLQVLVVVYSTFSDVTGGQVLSCQRQQSYVYDENRVIFYKYGESSSSKTYTLTKEQHPSSLGRDPIWSQHWTIQNLQVQCGWCGTVAQHEWWYGIGRGKEESWRWEGWVCRAPEEAVPDSRQVLREEQGGQYGLTMFLQIV